jgi:ribonuclease D
MPPAEIPELITDPEGLRAFAARLREQPHVAVDTESNSMHAYRERVCLLQFSVPDGDVILDPLAVPDLSPLASFFENPSQEKIFHAAEYDLICLRRDFGLRVRGLFDTHASIRSLGKAECGLGSILEAEFGVKLDKKMQRSDWGKRPLPIRQLEYAQYDTRYLLPLRDRLAEQLDAAGLMAEVRDEFLRLEGIPDLPQEPETDPFWRVRGVFDLPPAGRAVLRSLFDWREAQAEKIDRPPFHVLSEDSLVQIAKLAPENPIDLAEKGGLNPRSLERWGPGILQAVQSGRNRKPPSPPRRRGMDDRAQARLERLRQWRKTIARARGVESDVILSRDTMFRVAQSGADTLEALAAIPGMGAWRLETYGPRLIDLLLSPESKEAPCGSSSSAQPAP